MSGCEPPVWESDEDLLIEAERLIEEGHLEKDQSFFEKALGCYARALEIYRNQKNHNGMAEANRGIGMVHQQQARYDLAMHSYGRLGKY